jgi:hypothetical protein
VGFLFFSDALMLMVHPAHVVGIEPFTHTHPSAAVFRVFASIPAAQYSRNRYQDRKAHYKTDHRLSHGRLLNASQPAYILGHAF